MCPMIVTTATKVMKFLVNNSVTPVKYENPTTLMTSTLGK